VTIALAEMELPYQIAFVDIMAGTHPTPEFLALNPNGRMPVLTDSETGVTVFESAAILQYLGRKTGKLYPAEEVRRTQVESWLYWQMSGQGPMMGQVNFFTRAAARADRPAAETDFAIHRFRKETSRLLDVMERQLAGREYLCDDYSIADICAFPWAHRHNESGGGLAERPNLAAWNDRIAARPAVAAAMQVGYDLVKPKE
jgi:glutathione S-transferase